MTIVAVIAVSFIAGAICGGIALIAILNGIGPKW